MRAQHLGRTFEGWWDALNASSNKLALAASFNLGEVILGSWSVSSSLPHGIEIHRSHPPFLHLSQESWKERLTAWHREGWALDRMEMRQHRFEPAQSDRPERSHFHLSAHLTHAANSHRVIIEGPVVVEWTTTAAEDGTVPPARVDATGLTLRSRQGPPHFQCVLADSIAHLENTFSIDPLILHDLDGDGLSEVILAARNLVYRRTDENVLRQEPLCQHDPGIISTALIGDFDGDGLSDFLGMKWEGLILYQGASTGRFEQPPTLVWTANASAKHPMVMTCGDIDGDRDLDVFLAQYKVPYELGVMPTPFHDARDGHPAFLLLNNGQGRFTEATEASGLHAKRGRRTYSASWVDLDGDSDLDLAVVSDFAGIDLYSNDGRGRLTDITAAWIEEPNAFGMAHTVADFNRDGRLDLLMMGMTSPTADRLDHLDLWRSPDEADRTQRPRMAHGNRLYLARAHPGFDERSDDLGIARTGWSWGCTSLDYDNDGFADVYVVNGLESRESVRDYESEYWVHDRYVGGSTENSAAYLYFMAKFNRTRARGHSYGGYEKNRFHINVGGTVFVEVAHLLDLGLEEDSRNVAADDLDGDGRMDLLVTSYEVWPESRQTLRIFRNIHPAAANWIGFRFREKPGTSLPSPVGAQIELVQRSHRTLRTIVNGDSYRTQHAATAHFGLGADTEVEHVRIRWVGGRERLLRKPAINRYHWIEGPDLEPR